MEAVDGNLAKVEESVSPELLELLQEDGYIRCVERHPENSEYGNFNHYERTSKGRTYRSDRRWYMFERLFPPLLASFLGILGTLVAALLG